VFYSVLISICNLLNRTTVVFVIFLVIFVLEVLVTNYIVFVNCNWFCAVGFALFEQLLWAAVGCLLLVVACGLQVICIV